ncbi:MAG TPA: XdhC/CoxI family protein [Thermoanaerobaculia bacterium]|nr:XdhC/CoxI family protein [Thermoanaerobaculia bacterium]
MSLPAPADVLAEAARAVRADGHAVLCHVVRTEGSTPGKVGWRLLVRRDGTVFGNLGGGAFEALVKADGSARLAQAAEASAVKRYYLTETAVKGEATGMVCGGMIEVFLERLMANPMLVICGGGPVGQALAQAGALAGFDRLVVEDRSEFRAPELFPAGTEIAAADRDFAGDFLAPYAGRELYVAVVSRCWETDVGALAAVLRQAPADLRYLGLMGSRRKVARVIEEVEGRGQSLDGVTLSAPIGLPIGGDTPGEIAIAVLAEILSTRYESRTNHAA